MRNVPSSTFWENDRVPVANRVTRPRVARLSRRNRAPRRAAEPTGEIVCDRQTAIDEPVAPNQISRMKYLRCCFLAVVVAFSLFSFAVLDSRAREVQKQLGPHSWEKFAIVSHLGGPRASAAEDPNHPRTVAIVLIVEQTMKGKEQEITAKASAHRGGPTGTMINMDGLRVHVTQPADFGTKPQRTGETSITNAVPAPNGKYKTVVAEATINSPEYGSTVISLTVPGDK